MGQITKAGAWCNGEVAYLAWEADGPIADCLGFMIARTHLTGVDAGVRRILPTWIAFNDQSNPNWEDQDSSVWPIQSYQWRDLTLRKSRDTTNVRPIDFAVRYEITPVGLAGPGRAKVDPPERAAYRDANNQPRYTGAPRDLFVVGPTVLTNTVEVTHAYAADAGGPLVEATFTNGILSTQNLIKQLRAAAPAAAAAANTTAGLLTTLKKEIKKVESPIRAFLTGDVLAFLKRLVDRAETEGGQVHMALYELDDPELNALLIKTAQAGRLRLILSTAASADPNAKGTPTALRKPVVWDVENDGVRADLHAAAAGGSTVQDRMFNNADVIGHNKFAVYVKNGVAQSVLTGSTNWTQTGLCTQSNNAIIVHDKAVAGAYLAYWKRLEADAQPARVPLEVQVGNKTIEGSAANDATQGAVLRSGNSQAFGPFTLNDAATKTQLWCSPNTPSPNRNEHSPTPPDLNDVYWLMAHAKEAVFFLSFMPGESG
ncbi:MAG TPA: phospholipase D-like domain-containing protein, partial [Caulobacteraceae bacterium]|nr:phospholipase D-like domain-containing protein [Caulobacteraceae bacterium]